MYLLHLEGDEIRHIEFDETAAPKYAILSHTWGPDEVSFKDIRKDRGKSKAGFKKIEFCMERAVADGLHYCWVDTCCIDQTNNNEVSEAINSMFRWYQNAVKCYVYLSDVPQKTFQSSRWFTRGWTLQELLAPTIVEFFASDGQLIGNKISRLQDIHDRTQIPISALLGRELGHFSVEEKIRWIVQRQTKRDEDMVYSLLGIFEVSMPLIYGERRERALFRLCEQIEKSHTFTQFAHRFNLNNMAQVKDIRQISPLPANSQHLSRRLLTVLAGAQGLISQSGRQQTSNTNGWDQAVECEIGLRRSRFQHITDQRKGTTSNLAPKFECETCEKKFYSQIAANQHMDATSHWLPKFECETCEKKFHSQIAANQHMDATNHCLPKFECETCEKKFHSQIAANQHMDATSHWLPKFECETCEKKFYSQIAANQHMDATHHWAPKFKCKTCEKWFHDRTAVHQHMNATNH